MASMMNAESGDAGSDSALGDLKDIQADANTGSCDMEIYIAGTA